VERAHGTHQDRLVKKLRLAGIVNYPQANAYLEEHYLAEHNRRYARLALSQTDYHRYHRRRPTARQLDQVFRLEEERVVNEDWVVRYKNRLLQLQRQTQHWAPANSRVLVQENQTGELAILYRGKHLPFRHLLPASKWLKRGKRRYPFSRAPSPKPDRRVAAFHNHNHPWRQSFQSMQTPAFSSAW
jgi:hypothetical protein